MAVIPSIAQLTQIAGGVGNLKNYFFGQWTIVDATIGSNNYLKTICVFDSFIDFSFNKKNSVLEYPIEGGSFSTYNKQTQPFNIRATLAKSGLSFNYQKQAFIEALQKYADEALLVNVITPHATFTNCTLGGIDFENAPEENPNMLIVGLEIKEVRFQQSVTGSRIIQSPRNSNAAPVVNNGNSAPQSINLLLQDFGRFF